MIDADLRRVAKLMWGTADAGLPEWAFEVFSRKTPAANATPCVVRPPNIAIYGDNSAEGLTDHGAQHPIEDVSEHKPDQDEPEADTLGGEE